MFLINTYCHERLSELRQQQLVHKARQQNLLREAKGQRVERIVSLLSNVHGIPTESGKGRGRESTPRNPGRPISTPEV